MQAQAKPEQPAQVPGDAESPAKGQGDPTIKEAVKGTDQTEPVKGGATQAGQKPE